MANDTSLPAVVLANPCQQTSGRNAGWGIRRLLVKGRRPRLDRGFCPGLRRPFTGERVRPLTGLVRVMDRTITPAQSDATGRPARVGIVVGCLLALGLCSWLGNRIWQRLHPSAGIRIEDIPLAVEIAPDRILQITRGHLDPEILLSEIEAARQRPVQNPSQPRLAGSPDLRTGEADGGVELAQSTRRDRIRQSLASRGQPEPNSGRQDIGAVREKPESSEEHSGQLTQSGLRNDEPRAPSLDQTPGEADRTGSSDVAGVVGIGGGEPRINHALGVEGGESSTSVQPAGFVTDDQPAATREMERPSPAVLEPAESRFLPSFPGFGPVIPPTFAPPAPSEGGNASLTEREGSVVAPSPAAETEMGSGALPPPEASNGGSTWPRQATGAPGETLWELSARVYGDGRYFAALWAENKGPDQAYRPFATGDAIVCPAPEVLRRNWPEFCAGLEPAPPSGLVGEPNVYETRAGDTLFDIARRELGQASRFAELLELNRAKLNTRTGHLDPLPAGLKLSMPSERP